MLAQNKFQTRRTFINQQQQQEKIYKCEKACKNVDVFRNAAPSSGDILKISCGKRKELDEQKR